MCRPRSISCRVDRVASCGALSRRRRRGGRSVSLRVPPLVDVRLSFEIWGCSGWSRCVYGSAAAARWSGARGRRWTAARGPRTRVAQCRRRRSYRSADVSRSANLAWARHFCSCLMSRCTGLHLFCRRMSYTLLLSRRRLKSIMLSVKSLACKNCTDPATHSYRNSRGRLRTPRMEKRSPKRAVRLWSARPDAKRQLPTMKGTA